MRVRYEFPAGYGQHGCVLVPIDWRLLPLVAGALHEFEERRVWRFDTDHRAGYNAIAELYICMANGCITELVEAQNRLYRLLDTALNGTDYASTIVNGETVITPAIPITPPIIARSLHSRLERLEHILDNAYNGGVYFPDFQNSESLRDLLRELITAVGEAGPLDDDMLNRLAQIAVLLA